MSSFLFLVASSFVAGAFTSMAVNCWDVFKDVSGRCCHWFVKGVWLLCSVGCCVFAGVFLAMAMLEGGA